MSVYYPSFNYRGINSRSKNLIVVHLDGGDVGEMDSFLGMEPIYTDNSDGTKRIDYGAKYNNVATPRITVVKQDGSEMSVAEIRDCLKWLTGAKKVSPLDITEHFEESFVYNSGNAKFVLNNQADMIYSVYVDGVIIDESKWAYDFGSKTVTLTSAPRTGASVRVIYNKIKFSFVGRVTNVWHYKMDARTVGLVIEFTGISPWAISPIRRIATGVEGTASKPTVITINNDSDDLDSYVYMKTTYENGIQSNSVVLENITIQEITNVQESTEVTNLDLKEKVYMDGNLMITSSKSTRIFGNDFNFCFPRLAPGENVFHVIGQGTLTFEYTVPLKVGDCAMDINSNSNFICD